MWEGLRKKRDDLLACGSAKTITTKLVVQKGVKIEPRCVGSIKK
jgi:hypothetical protein